MPFGSRLRTRRKKRTVNVATRAGVVVVNGLTPTWQPASKVGGSSDERITAQGGVKFVTDVFFFEPVNGTLPAINHKHIMTDTATSFQYEVLTVADQAGNGTLLMVEATRVDWSI